MRAHAGWGEREKAARGRVPARAVTCPYIPQLYAEPFYVCFQKSFFFVDAVNTTVKASFHSADVGL